MIFVLYELCYGLIFMIKTERLPHNLVVIDYNNLLVLLRINNRIPINFHPFPCPTNSSFSNGGGGGCGYVWAWT